ncbi:MAG: PQQ-binding-like beta-propeller repeat protein [Reinekea sp.]
MRNGLVSILAAIALGACASGDLIEQPKALPESLPQKVDLQVQWWDILGDQYSAKAFGQRVPVVFGDNAYVALADGSVFLMSPDGDARVLGKHTFGITAPLGVDGQDIVVLDRQGRVAAYDHDFQQRWSLTLNALSVEAPLLTDSRLFVQTIDGRINAIERITGRLLWVYQDAEPNLTLTGTSTPVLINTDSGPAIVSGLANGKVVALSVVDGSVIWEYRIARATGRSDVSRLVDVDAQVTNLGDRLVVSGYQGDLVVIDNRSGQVLQAKNFSSYRSVAVTDNAWFGVDAQSHLVALNPLTLEVLWTNSDFEYRQLSEVLVSGDYIVVSDAEGFMHVVDSSSGEWLGSRHIDWRGAKTDPVAFGHGILMQGYSTRVKLINIVAQ